MKFILQKDGAGNSYPVPVVKITENVLGAPPNTALVTYQIPITADGTRASQKTMNIKTSDIFSSFEEAEVRCEERLRIKIREQTKQFLRSQTVAKIFLENLDKKNVTEY